MKSKIVSSLIALVLFTAPAWADHGRGHAGGGWHANSNQGARWHDHDNDWGRGARDVRGWGWQNANQPPGWSRGRKTGWGNCDVPPGQAKKQGCGVWSNGWWRNDRDRDRDSRWRRGGWRGNGDNDDDDRAPVWQNSQWRRPPTNRRMPPVQPIPSSGTTPRNWPAAPVASGSPAPSPQPVWRHR